MKQLMYTLASLLPFVLSGQPFGTNFDSWAIHAEGSWSETETEGTYRGNGIYCNFGNENSGLRKIGFNGVGDQLQLPRATNPGTLSFVARTSSGSGARLRVRYSDGGNVATAAEFSINSTSYRSYSAFIGAQAENVAIWIEMSGYGNSVFLDDLGLTELVILPVELVAFEARPQADGTVTLHWRTLTETDNSHFTVERSADGRQFTAIGRREGAGNSFTSRDYQFTDTAPLPGLSYYRLRQTDTDGTTALSEVISVQTTAPDKARPTLTINSNELYLYLPYPPEASGTLRLFDMTGRLLLQCRLAAGHREHRLSLPMLAAGMYVAQVQVGREGWTERVHR